MEISHQELFLSKANGDAFKKRALVGFALDSCDRFISKQETDPAEDISSKGRQEN